MTAKQKANRERFKKVVAEAKKLRKKNPKLTQAQAVKQAWAISYTKKKTKKAVGVAKKRKTVTGERHKDTNSHNVKISVMSGIHKQQIESLEKAIKRKEFLEAKLNSIKSITPKKRSAVEKYMFKDLPKLIKGEKELITIIKRGIK